MFFIVSKSEYSGGRDKILPSPSLREVLNPLQERVKKSPRFRTLTQKVGTLAI